MTTLEAYSQLRILVERQGAELNQFLGDVQSQLPKEDFARLRAIVARIMGHGHYDAFFAIADDVPELTPEWARDA